jgi:hypothetical protein
MAIPFSILVVLILLALQLMLLIFLKKYRRIVLFSMIPVIGIGIWQGFKEYNRTNPDLSKVKPDVKISAAALLTDYEENDLMANQKYLGKIVELDGPVKEMENSGTGNFTVILGEPGALSSIRCKMDTLYTDEASKIIPGSSIIIRGECTGYQKNEMLGIKLGSDVQLVRCVIIRVLENK